MAARGVTDVVGITTAETYEVEMKKASIASSDQRILLVDSSKFGKAWYAKYADFGQISMIITDSNIQREYVEMIKDAGITLHIV